MRDKVIPENSRLLKYIPDCYKNQKVCNKAVRRYFHALEFILKCYKTHKMCNEAVKTSPSAM